MHSGGTAGNICAHLESVVRLRSPMRTVYLVLPRRFSASSRVLGREHLGPMRIPQSAPFFCGTALRSVCGPAEQEDQLQGIATIIAEVGIEHPDVVRALCFGLRCTLRLIDSAASDLAGPLARNSRHWQRCPAADDQCGTWTVGLHLQGSVSVACSRQTDSMASMAFRTMAAQLHPIVREKIPSIFVSRSMHGLSQTG